MFFPTCSQNNTEFHERSTPKWMLTHKLPALPVNWQKTPPLLKAVMLLLLPIAAQISRWWGWRVRLTNGVHLKHTGTAGDLCSHVPSQPAGTSCWLFRENILGISKTETFSSGACNSEFRLFFPALQRGFLPLLNVLSANPSTGILLVEHNSAVPWFSFLVRCCAPENLATSRAIL